jgi:uncharacterized protein (DUF736 family)
LNGHFAQLRGHWAYTGELATLSAAARKVVFRPIDAKTDKAPCYRVIGTSDTADVEAGAAWKKRSEEGREYLSVKLDDPALPQPVNCAMVESGDTLDEFILVWSRDSRKAKAK